jgi:hypothetical protein
MQTYNPRSSEFPAPAPGNRTLDRLPATVGVEVIRFLSIFACFLTTAVGISQTAIPILCPVNTPCKSIDVLIQDGTHGTITVVLDVPQLEAQILSAAQANINQNLPTFLTSQLSFPTERYLNGRINLNQATLAGTNVACGNPPAPPPHPGPPGPICPPPQSPSADGFVSLQLLDASQKDHYELHVHPLPPFATWDEIGWETEGRFTLFASISMGVDAQVSFPLQSAVLTIREDHADGILTTQIFPGSTFSFNIGKSQTFSLPMLDTTTAAQYPFLSGLSVTSLGIDTYDSQRMTIIGAIGPAPALINLRQRKLPKPPKQ